MGKTIPEYLSTFAQDNNEGIAMTSNHGYVIAPQKILRCFRLNEIEKLLLLELLSYMGDNDFAYPSHKRLAFKLGKKSVSSIKKALTSLKEKGFITWSKGGGDTGSNHYRLTELRLNPYIILSEFVHFFVECILKKYRNEISYETIYGSVLHLVEKKGTDKEIPDVYGVCLEQLGLDFQLAVRTNMYDLLAEHLLHEIFLTTKISLKIDTLQLIEDHFKQFHPDIELDDEDHAINKVLKGPNDSKEFEVIDENISPEILEIARREYPRIQAFLEEQDEYTLYIWFIYNIILPNSRFYWELECSIDEFRKENEDDKVNLLKKKYRIEYVKLSLANFHIDAGINKAIDSGLLKV